MKLFHLSAASLLALLAVPVQAQSFYPMQAGVQFCTMRQRGINFTTALRTSITDNWSSTRPRVIYRGRITTDVADFIDLVMRQCPEAFTSGQEV